MSQVISFRLLMCVFVDYLAGWQLKKAVESNPSHYRELDLSSSHITHCSRIHILSEKLKYAGTLGAIHAV